jgi:carbonic anhydrase
MSITDEVLKANEQFAANFREGNLAMPPARKLAVLACMDARIDVNRVLGLGIGDAHVIRNAGGIATDDAIRSLIISHHLLGTREFAIINHTDCGMLTFQDRELQQRLRAATGADANIAFHAFSDVERNVREQIDRVRSHPWIPKEIPVRGFIYDVKNGRLSEVRAARPAGG